MHQSKRFDFIEEVDESDNISAYFSRMTTLKQGGHLPGLDINAIGSYAEKDQDEDPDCIEVDFDVGFVQKSLHPIFSGNSWEEDGNVDGVLEQRHRYISIEASAEEDEEEDHRCAPGRFGTSSDEDEISQNEGLIEQQNSSRTSFIPSPGPASFAERVFSEDESLGLSPQVPIVVYSQSDGEGQGKPPIEFAHADPTPPIMPGLSSYESDNDEWLRKRDLATRKTRNPKSWLTRTTSGIQSKLSFVTVETPKAINGVAAAKKLMFRTVKRRGGRRRNPIPSTKVWKLSYKERTKDHPGYFDVDFFSLFESSAVGALPPHDLDAAPWESRDVRQHFLHDRSISFSKNWFGKFDLLICISSHCFSL
jgi:hypothetical protein